MAAAVLAVDRVDAVGTVGGRVVFVDHRIQRAAARAILELAQQIPIPPDRFGRPEIRGPDLIALRVEGAGLGGIGFAAAIARIQIKRDAATDIGDAAGIPFLEQHAAAEILQRRRQQRAVVLLDRIHLQPGAVGINVRDVITVAMNEFGIVEQHAARDVVGDDGGNLHEVVLAVVVHVGDAKLVAFGLVLAGDIAAHPALGQLAVAEIPRHRLALEIAAAHAVLAVEQDARMDAVPVDDAGMAVQRAVGEIQIWNHGARALGTCHAVHDGEELRGVIVRRDGEQHTTARSVVRHAIRRAHDDLGLAVAVEVIDGHVILVADADGGGVGFVGVRGVGAERPHVHFPQERAVAEVGLEELHLRPGGGTARQAIHEIIVFAVAVKIPDPAKLHVVGRIPTGGGHLQRKRDVLAHGRIRRQPGRRAGRLLDAADHRTDIPGIRHREIRRGVEIVRRVGDDGIGVQQHARRAVGGAIDVETDVRGIRREQTPADVSL